MKMTTDSKKDVTDRECTQDLRESRESREQGVSNAPPPKPRPRLYPSQDSSLVLRYDAVRDTKTEANACPTDKIKACVTWLLGQRTEIDIHTLTRMVLGPVYEQGDAKTRQFQYRGVHTCCLRTLQVRLDGVVIQVSRGVLQLHTNLVQLAPPVEKTSARVFAEATHP